MPKLRVSHYERSGNMNRIWRSLIATIGVCLLPVVAAADEVEVAHFRDLFKEDGGAALKAPHKVGEQEQSQWCWAACIQVTLAYHKIDRTQEQIVTSCFKQKINAPMVHPEYARNALVNLKKAADGSVEIVGAKYFPGGPSGNDLVSELDSDHPVMMAYLNPDGKSGHMIVVFAAEYSNRPNGKEVTKVTYWDPFPGRGIETVTRQELAPRVAWWFAVRGWHEGGPGSEVDLADQAKAVATNLFDGDFASVREHFSDNLRKKLSEDQLKQGLNQKRAPVGELISVGEAKASKQEGKRFYDVRCKCKLGIITVRMVYNAEDEIEGFWLL